jgi:hypothetical protein
MAGMKAAAKFLAALAIAFLATAAHAQPSEPQADEPSTPQYTQADLDEMLAPIALYPDELLSQILMAATYPLEVVQAARWSRAHPDLSGSTAVWAVDGEDWDPSVKSLVAFPELVSMMSERLDWTQRLGEAFLGQEDLAAESVQRLRKAAYDQGNLRSSDEMTVANEGEDIMIEPSSPDMVYVPYYDPRQIYGPWWWPDEPVYWDPWPGYNYGPAFGFGWGLGISVGSGFFFGGFDWHRHHVRVRDDRHPFYYHGRDHRPIADHGGDWRHDPDHRRGVPYRNPLLRREFGGAARASDARREYRGHQQPSGGFFAPQPSAPSAIARPTLPGARTNGPATRNNDPATRAPSLPIYRNMRPAQEARPQVFEGVGQGRETRGFSARGQQSLQGRAPAPAVSQPRSLPQAPMARPSAPAMRSAPAPQSSPAPAQNSSPAPAQRSAPAARGTGRQER